MEMRVFDGEFDLQDEQAITLIMNVEEARKVKAAIDELIEVTRPDWMFHLRLSISRLGEKGGGV